jgi:aspartate-semialdehyde dehydrogenase
MKIAVVGATGLVGQEMLKVLEEMKLPLDHLIPVASAKSVGREVIFNGMFFPVVSLDEGVALEPDIALFSAGSEVSREWAPRFASGGCRVIDNSSCWRMNPEVPLVVPEINANVLGHKDFIIANPNCSTIQLVVALAPLARRYGLKRVVVSTYQRVTGSGARGIQQLKAEREGQDVDKIYPWTIDLNLIPHGGHFLADGYTTEEQKLVDESRKILSIPELRLTATVVRVPVYGGHSESVNVELNHDFDLEELKSLLKNSPGISMLDNPAEFIYPMPRYVQGKNDVFVGRIRRDSSAANSLNMWIVADNLRKGAATNACQIADYLIKEKLV